MNMFLATLVVLLPLLVSCAAFDPASVNMDSMAEKKRALLSQVHLASQISDIQNQICALISSDPDHETCEKACPIYTELYSGGSLMPMCGSICKTIHCYL